MNNPNENDSNTNPGSVIEVNGQEVVDTSTSLAEEQLAQSRKGAVKRALATGALVGAMAAGIFTGNTVSDNPGEKQPITQQDAKESPAVDASGSDNLHDPITQEDAMNSPAVDTSEVDPGTTPNYVPGSAEEAVQQQQGTDPLATTQFGTEVQPPYAVPSAEVVAEPGSEAPLNPDYVPGSATSGTNEGVNNAEKPN